MATVNGITAPLMTQCRLLKLDYRRVRSLMSERGWSAEYAIANYSPKPDHKLTQDDVQLIRWVKGMTQPELAEIHGVIQQNISMIQLGKRWKHVPPFSIDEFMTRALMRLRCEVAGETGDG
jgi:hypothetical protein